MKTTPLQFQEALLDFGGHDIERLTEVLLESKEDKKKPTIVIAHTVKGWGLDMAALAGNHSALPSKKEMERLTEAQGLSFDRPFQRFDTKSPEGKFLKKRGEELLQDIQAQEELRKMNSQTFQTIGDEVGCLPNSLEVNLKLASYPHSQWMLGQLTAKTQPYSQYKLRPSRTEKRRTSAL